MNIHIVNRFLEFFCDYWASSNAYSDLTRSPFPHCCGGALDAAAAGAL
jgi:hypothetical protein